MHREHHPLHLPALGAILGACLIVVYGCGSSGSRAGESTVSQITKSQLIRQGDRICEKTEKRQEESVRAYALKQGPDVDLSEESQAVQVVLKAGLPPIRRQLKELKALGIPEGGEELLDAFYSETEKAIKRAEQDPSSMLVGATNPFNKSKTLGAGYGFTVCGGA